MGFHIQILAFLSLLVMDFGKGIKCIFSFWSSIVPKQCFVNR